MPPNFVSGNEYKGTQSFDGKWSGTGFYPEETLKYFDFYFKGKQAEHTGYMPNELLFETLTTNSPDITVLDIERRNFDSETMAAIANCLHGNTHVKELKFARNVAFWSEQPDDFGMALAPVLKENKTITKVDLKNNDIHQDAVVAIMDALKVNTTITWLDFSDNFSRGKGEEIADMIRTNKTLTYLNLNVNQLTDEDSEAVLAAVDANTTLKEFSAYNNGAVDKLTRKKLRGFKR
jgi:Ran GTPase-activating protein (RanGAP) involved in mRNA processing and transport